MKHTKGPWKVGNYGGINNCIIPESAMPDNSGFYQSGEYICTLHDTLHNTIRGNAPLIAAAPELYEALEHAYNWMIGYCEKGKIETPDWMKQARAALAKAEGGNHEAA